MSNILKQFCFDELVLDYMCLEGVSQFPNCPHVEEQPPPFLMEH